MSHAVDMAWAWIKINPKDTIFVVWILMNVVWAQLPKSWFHNPILNRILTGIHTCLQFVVTHSSVSGTFTWPSILKALFQTFGATIAPAAPEIPIVMPAGWKLNSSKPPPPIFVGESCDVKDVEPESKHVLRPDEETPLDNPVPPARP